MNPLTPIIEQQGFVMLDGGLATELESRGADLDHALWSAKMLNEAPEMILAAHMAYLEAGADIIATTSYQASFEGFLEAGFGHEQAKSLFSQSIELAVLAREKFWMDNRGHPDRARPLIAISIGPYGACLHDGSEYHGNYGVSRETLKSFHQPRMELLANTGADLFAFETIPSLLEAEVLVELLQGFPGHYAWLSFSCRDGTQVSHGESFAQCAELADQAEQIAAVGVNCTAPEFINELLESTRHIVTPRVVYPNSGEVWKSEGNQWEGEPCEQLSATDWYDRGARLIGGCCRTAPADISRMRSLLTDHAKGHGNTGHTIVE